MLPLVYCRAFAEENVDAPVCDYFEFLLVAIVILQNIVFSI